MKRNFHETIDEVAVALPSDRSTGLVLAGASAVAATIWRSEPTVLIAALAVAGLLGGLSLAAPATLNPLNRAWMEFGRLLGKVVSPFGTTIVPFGLMMQLKGDPLRRRSTEADETFWIVPRVSFAPWDEPDAGSA